MKERPRKTIIVKEGGTHYLDKDGKPLKPDKQPNKPKATPPEDNNNDTPPAE